MGLDMYLYRQVETWDDDVTVEMKDSTGKVLVSSKEDGRSSIETNVIYWRKSNAIHQWFVDHVQEGVDECQRSDEFEVEVLVDLLDLVTHALKTKDAEMLPPQGGFFFGSTDVDEYYWGDLKETKKELKKVIAKHKELEQEAKKLKRNLYITYRYQSSW